MRATVEAIIATTHPIEAYGGVRVSKEALGQMAEQLRGNRVPLLKHHDVRQEWSAEVVDARVRKRDDGEYEVWARFDVDADGWAEFQRELKEAGAPGGMSFSTPQFLAALNFSAPDEPDVVLAADAHHFDDDVIVSAAQELLPLGRIEADRYFQFSTEPLAVVLVFLGQTALQVPAGVLANYLYAAISRLVAHRSPSESIVRTYVDEVADEATGRTERKSLFEVQTKNDQVAKHAIDALAPLLAEAKGKFIFDATTSTWRKLEPPDGE